MRRSRKETIQRRAADNLLKREPSFDRDLESDDDTVFSDVGNDSYDDYMDLYSPMGSPMISRANSIVEAD